MNSVQNHLKITLTSTLNAIVLLILFPVQAWAADFEKGLEHMEDGDYAMAFCLWDPLARLGHPDAQYHLGWLYANGNGLNVDVSKAVYWRQQAANNNYLDAQFAIGLAYTTGEGIKADRDEAFRWFLKAAIAGHVDAKEIVTRLIQETGNDYYNKYPILKKLAWLKQSVIVTRDVVNVRSGPGTEHDIVYKAQKDQILDKISQQGDWFEVVINDQESDVISGWIYASLVKKL